MPPTPPGRQDRKGQPAGGHRHLRNSAKLEATPPHKSQDYKSQITFVKDRPGPDYRYAMDPAKVEAALGGRPQEAFAAGLRKTVQWYLDNQPWYQAVKQGYQEWQRQGLKRAASP